MNKKRTLYIHSSQGQGRGAGKGLDEDGAWRVVMSRQPHLYLVSCVNVLHKRICCVISYYYVAKNVIAASKLFCDYLTSNSNKDYYIVIIITFTINPHTAYTYKGEKKEGKKNKEN